jgi:RimJ/RimL family protein N-acetyltransferase
MSPDGRDLRDPVIFRGTAICWYVARSGYEIVGIIGFGGGSFGFWIAPRHRRQGYASEMVCAFSARPAFYRMMLSAGCFDDNVASRKIIERANLVEEKRMTIQSRLLPEPRMAVFFTRR